MKNRIISILLLLSLVFNFQGTVPAFAEETANVKELSHKVEYFVRDSWGETQIIEIKITNTGERDLEGWGIKFSAEGKIENLWGASIYKHESDSYILEGNKENAVIKPNMSATIGYRYLSGNKEKPEVKLCSMKTALKRGYKVAVKKTSAWDTNGIVELTITNTTEKPIKYWELDFNADFTITDAWNGKLIEHKENTYKIKGSDNTQIIPPKKSVTVGMQCSNVNNLEITEDILTASVLELDLSQMVLSVLGSYYESTEEIKILWNSDIKDGSFALLESEDGSIFAETVSVTNQNSYLYKLKDTSRDSYYFKIVQKMNDGQTLESNLLVMKKTENGYELQPVDTDGDGLDDLFEISIGTDYKKHDTDGDGLTDYQELNLTYTDPLDADTDTNGIGDAFEDLDKDGISNLSELLLGLMPLSDDTDTDGLKDGDEIGKYKTDPTKYDTDEDGISDGEELTIALDPTNPKTHGIPDGEYTFAQTISKEELSEINKENDYELSIDLEAAGNAGNAFTIRESGYKEALSGNDAMVGKMIELSYEDLKVESAELTFKLKEDIIEHSSNNYAEEPGLAGIQRYQIFHYDEEMKILYPIKTEFDTNNNTLTVNASELGSYCIIDMDQWMYGLGIRPEQAVPVMNEMAIPFYEPALNETPIQSDNASENNKELGDPTSDPGAVSHYYDEYMWTQVDEIFSATPAALALSGEETKPEYNRQIDLVFSIDTSLSMEEAIDSCKAKMGQLVKKLYDAGITANVAVTAFGDYRQSIRTYRTGGEIWAKNPAEAESLISQVDLFGLGYENHLDAMETVCGLPYRKSAVKFAVLVTDEPITLKDNNCKKTTAQVAEELKKAGVITSVISAGSGTFEPLYQVTGGMQTSVYGSFHQSLYDFICKYITNMEGFNFIGATDLCSKMLSKPLMKDGQTDTDGDGLTDSEEVDWDTMDKLLKNYTDSNGNVLALPTFKDFKEYERESDIEGFERLEPHYQESISEINILPIKSDPTSEDGDMDGILDIDDQPDMDCKRYEKINPLKKDTLETIFQLHISNNFRNPIYLEIKDNVVTINARINFYNVKRGNEKVYASNKTYVQAAVEGIKEKWTTTLTGTKYDFMPGLKGSVVVNLDYSVSDDRVKDYLANKYLNICTLDFTGISAISFVSRIWKINNRNTLLLFSGYHDVNKEENKFGDKFDPNKEPNNFPYFEEDYKGVIAHEFGHALGIYDAYPINGEETPAQNDEVRDGASYGNIMYRGGIVYNNDVEMMLEAFSTNEMQYFRDSPYVDSSAKKSIVLRIK